MNHSNTMNVEMIRQQFPILSRKINGNPLIYFDNAATTQKPQSVIDSIAEYYTQYNSNVHRGIHTLSEASTALYEESRTVVAQFLHTSAKNIIFTKGATEAINLVAFSYIRNMLEEGDEIILSIFEHHSNIIPWQQICQEKGAHILYIENIEELGNVISEKTKLIAITAMSNVTGKIFDIKKIKSMAQDIPICVDVCQAVAHQKINVQEWDCDFLVFSGHKLYGPTGIGVLYVKENHHHSMTPYQTGGGMIDNVSEQKSTWTTFPHLFEAGTPNIAQAIGLSYAIQYITSIGQENIFKHEKKLTTHALKALYSIPEITVYVDKCSSGIISFTIADVHPHDIAAILDQHGIAIRAGHHCCQILMKHWNIPATARISFGIYNTIDEINTFINILKNIRNIFV